MLTFGLTSRAATTCLDSISAFNKEATERPFDEGFATPTCRRLDSGYMWESRGIGDWVRFQRIYEYISETL
ncbi:Protein of unknown function [Gryllus bimaculatus]|nr:Protein of unknown function [Gryllus bimaculatus]